MQQADKRVAAHLHTISHEVDIGSWRIVPPCIGEHQLHIIKEVLGALVGTTVHLGFDAGKVYGLLDDIGVILEDVEVHRLCKWKGPLQ